MKIFILVDEQVYNLLLSKRWIYRVCIIQDHGARTLIINGINGRKRVVNRQEVNFLVVELVNLAEIENLEIDLADEEVYQLFHDVNEAEYYHN